MENRRGGCRAQEAWRAAYCAETCIARGGSEAHMAKMTWAAVLSVTLAGGVQIGCTPEAWQPLWKSYTAQFMDDQTRVIDHDDGERTTSEAQAYSMFFALVANDRPRFDRLLQWTELNLASGDLAAHLPAWLWGRDPKTNRWG